LENNERGSGSDGPDEWTKVFIVLTNVGVLVFEDENLLKPSRILPLY